MEGIADGGILSDLIGIAEEADEGESPDVIGQFQYGQRVRIIDTDQPFNGQVGAVVEYDTVEDKWRIFMENDPDGDGIGLMVQTSNLEAVDEYPDNWVKYQIPGEEEVWAYMNTVTKETRWDAPGHAVPSDIPEMLPTEARAFLFHIVHRYSSVTRAYGQICEAAAQQRPYGTASLTSGASMDRADFIASCLELNLVQDDSAKIAGQIFDGIDLDGTNLHGDRLLTITDFHAADDKYHSVKSGAFGEAHAPIGLILFWPELVPAMFQQRAGFSPSASPTTSPEQRRAHRRFMGF